MTSDRSTGSPALRSPANRVSPRAIPYWTSRAALGWLAVIGVQIVAWVFDWPVPPWRLPVLAGTVVVAAIHLAAMPRLRYRVHRWELTDTAVYTRSGWWTREWRIAPLIRVQTVDSTDGPLARAFGLTELTVTTASAAGPLTIAGLDRGTASDLAGRITAAAQAGPGDAT
jgi:membrane protein YdbS with pleckstrin-like domain